VKYNENRLLDYQEFLLNYPWREKHLPSEVEGLLKVIGQLLEGESK
jgi:hypothetical protein